ncbi:MAG TPA: hypothetical protein PLF40_22640 [Kofleriaceae bacterium]|nr:hypothetical protein [Kofleriaceae bacterium]
MIRLLTSVMLVTMVAALLAMVAVLPGAGAPLLVNRPPATIPISHITTTDVVAHRLAIHTLLGVSPHAWMRRLDAHTELDGAVIEVMADDTTPHAIYVIEVLPARVTQ